MVLRFKLGLSLRFKYFTVFEDFQRVWAVIFGRDKIEEGGEHIMDDRNFEKIIIELPPEKSDWYAIHDRIKKASFKKLQKLPKDAIN